MEIVSPEVDAASVSDNVAFRARLPVAGCGRDFDARVGRERSLLPEGSANVDVLGDCAVMREFADACVEP
jgi:hypothetical protein